MTQLSYQHHLVEAIRRDPPRRKGKRTKAKLIEGAAIMLEERGYHAVRISDICDAVDVRMPTFYLYFKDKREITFEVLSDFGRFVLGSIRNTQPPQDPLAAINAANKVFIDLVLQNIGLMRCLFQFADEDEEFRRIHQSMTHEWYLQISRGMQRRMQKLDVDPDRLLLSIYVVGGMIDQLMRDLYVGNNPFLKDLIDKAASDTDQLSSLVSLIWFNGLKGISGEFEPNTATPNTGITS